MVSVWVITAQLLKDPAGTVTEAFRLVTSFSFVPPGCVSQDSPSVRGNKASRSTNVLSYLMGQLDEDEVSFDFTDFTSVLSSMMFSFALTGDSQGRFFYSPTSSETYEMFAFNSDGSELIHITRDIPRVEKTEQEMEDEIMYIESWANRMGMQGVVIEWEPYPYRAFIKALGVDDSGRLWVVRGTELEPVFDVYDMSAALLFSARLPVESGSWKFHIDSYGILGWEEDPEEGFQKLYVIDFPVIS